MYDLVGDRIQAIFDAQIVDIAVVEPELEQVRFPYTIERGVRFPEETMPIIGPRRHVIETRKPLLVNRDVDRIGPQAGAGARRDIGRAAAVRPLGPAPRRRARCPAIISLQNIDREDAFSESDVELLTTLAASLSVALENVRLIDETRQRLAELATVNEVGQALSTQLDLGVLIELVGEQLRTTFEADICYVALHDVAKDQIDVPVLPRGRRARAPGAIPVRRGADLADPRSRASRSSSTVRPTGTALPSRGVGIQAKSYLGVPIMVGEQAIGAISVQSTTREGRFGESDARLLSTIAANVGVAIQNARLYQEAHRRGDEMAVLAEVGQEISATLDTGAVIERIGERVHTLLNADTTALFVADPDGRTYRAILAIGELADAIRADTVDRRRGNHRERHPRSRSASS